MVIASDRVGANGGSPLQEFDVQHLQFKLVLDSINAGGIAKGRSARLTSRKRQKAKVKGAQSGIYSVIV